MLMGILMPGLINAHTHGMVALEKDWVANFRAPSTCRILVE